MPEQPLNRHLTAWALMSVMAAVVTMGLKFGAYLVTDSVGLLSDAVESSANLVAAIMALIAIWYAAKPADRTHPYGHEKIEFFSSAVEGSLVLLAGASIIWYAVHRLFAPMEVTAVGVGSIVALVATAINFGVSRLLMRQAAEHHSIVLEADGKHLMADVWTSVGVVAGLGLFWLTGVAWLDPVIALLVAINILWTGFGLLRLAFDGLMDRALPPHEQTAVRLAIETQLREGEAYHALRTRRAGTHRFVDLHVLVPGEITVARGHKIATSIEREVSKVLFGAETTVHIEPIEDRLAWQDSPLLPIEPPPVNLPLAFPFDRVHD